MATRLYHKYQQANHLVRQSNEMQLIGFAPDSETSLYLYARFRQVASGDVSGQRPDAIRVIDREKYDAWSSIKGMIRDVAMYEYLNALHQYIKTIDLSAITNDKSRQFMQDLINITTLDTEIASYIQSLHSHKSNSGTGSSSAPSHHHDAHLIPPHGRIHDSLDQSNDDIYAELARIQEMEQSKYINRGPIGQGIATPQPHGTSHAHPQQAASMVSQIHGDDDDNDGDDDDNDGDDDDHNNNNNNNNPTTTCSNDGLTLDSALDSDPQNDQHPPIPSPPSSSISPNDTPSLNTVNSPSPPPSSSPSQPSHETPMRQGSKPTTPPVVPPQQQPSTPHPLRSSTPTIHSPIRIRSRSTGKPSIRTVAPTPSHADHDENQQHRYQHQQEQHHHQHQLQHQHQQRPQHIQQIYQQLVYQAEENEDYTLYLILKLMNAREQRVEACLQELQKQNTLLTTRHDSIYSRLQRQEEIITSSLLPALDTCSPTSALIQPPPQQHGQEASRYSTLQHQQPLDEHEPSEQQVQQLSTRLTTIETHVENIVNAIHTINADILTSGDPTNLLIYSSHATHHQQQPPSLPSNNTTCEASNSGRWVHTLSRRSLSMIVSMGKRSFQLSIQFVKFFIFFLISKRLYRYLQSSGRLYSLQLFLRHLSHQSLGGIFSSWIPS